MPTPVISTSRAQQSHKEPQATLNQLQQVGDKSQLAPLRPPDTLYAAKQSQHPLKFVSSVVVMSMGLLSAHATTPAILQPLASCLQLSVGSSATHVSACCTA